MKNEECSAFKFNEVQPYLYLTLITPHLQNTFVDNRLVERAYARQARSRERPRTAPRQRTLGASYG